MTIKEKITNMKPLTVKAFDKEEWHTFYKTKPTEMVRSIKESHFITGQTHDKSQYVIVRTK